MLRLALLSVSLFSWFFPNPLSIVITSLGKRELVYVLFVHLFVYVLHALIFILCVRGWLRLVIVALPGFFY